MCASKSLVGYGQGQVFFFFFLSGQGQVLKGCMMATELGLWDINLVHFKSWFVLLKGIKKSEKLWSIQY